MEIKRFLGLRNTTAPENMKAGALDIARDVDIDDAGALRTRDGQTLITATASHSMWSSGTMCLLVQGVDLKRMDTSGALTQLRRLTSAEPVSYAELNNVVYFSNGADTGRIVQGVPKEWGIRVPVGQPAALETPYGNLPPGAYQYAVTYLRVDGLESGTPLPGVINLPTGGGIELTGIPSSSDPDVVARVLYLSGANGMELFRAFAVSVGVGSASLRAPAVGPVLDADYVEPAPAGTVVEIHAGVAYVADGSTIWLSDQHSLERFRRRTRFLPFPGSVTLMGSVVDGMYVATDSGTWYLAGNDSQALKAIKVLDSGATPGTMVKFDAAELSDDQDEAPANSVVGLLWASPEGVIMAKPGGVVRNLTDGNYNFLGGVRGAAILKAARGYASYVTTIRGAGDAPNAY